MRNWKCRRLGMAETDDIIDLMRMAELDGMEAFVSGDGREANPFTPGNELHEAWERGWQDAEARHV
jgi:ribosome modulation factor